MNWKEKIRAVVFDYDGTLVDYRGRACDPTKIALKKLRENGYTMVLCSGRPSFILLPPHKENFGHCDYDYVFGYSGSEYYDPKTDQSTYLKTFSPDTIRDIYDSLNCDFITLCLFEKENFYVSRKDIPASLYRWCDARLMKPVYKDFTKDVDRTYPNVLAYFEPADHKRVEEVISRVHDERFDLAFSAPDNVEILPHGINKSCALDKLRELTGIEYDEMLCFGDSNSDLQMLQKGTGVLMGNASKDLYDLVKYHTDSVDKLGIAQFLKEEGLID